MKSTKLAVGAITAMATGFAAQLAQAQPAATGAIAAKMVARAPTDGYTLLLCSGATLIQQYSLVAPAGTPSDIVNRWHREITQRFVVPEVRRGLAHEGIELRTSTPVELGNLNAEQFAKCLKVIQQAGIAQAG